MSSFSVGFSRFTLCCRQLCAALGRLVIKMKNNSEKSQIFELYNQLSNSLRDTNSTTCPEARGSWLELGESLFSLIKQHGGKVKLLSSLRKKFDKIAHFGCNNGNETLALMWLLNVTEIVGIDNEITDQARDLQTKFQSDRPWVKLYLDLPHNIHPQFREFIDRFDNLNFPRFIEGDMTTTIDKLPSNYFDLAYCERVLNQIVCEKSGQAQDNVSNAVNEMARVVKPGGVVVAIEPKKCLSDRDREQFRNYFVPNDFRVESNNSSDNHTLIDLDEFFEKVGLTAIRSNTLVDYSDKSKRLYLYEKIEQHRK